MSGIIGTSPNMRSGVVGQTAIDPSKDSWWLVLGAVHSGGGVIDFNIGMRLGSNLSYSGGLVTVGKPGWYSVSFNLGNNVTDATATQAHLGKNGHATGNYQTERIYWASANEISYYGESKTTIVEMAAGDTLEVYALEGEIYGNSTWYYSMSSFKGNWIGS
jgi:hypothetical protein